MTSRLADNRDEWQLFGDCGILLGISKIYIKQGLRMAQVAENSFSFYANKQQRFNVAVIEFIVFWVNGFLLFCVNLRWFFFLSFSNNYHFPG